MRTTIDRVEDRDPEQAREALSPNGGAELDVTIRDGVLEIEPVPTRMRPERTAGHAVRRRAWWAAVPEQELPPLTADKVRATLE